MFIGHFGVGLGLKRAAPEVSLGTLFLGAQLLDLVWPTLLLLGVERVEITGGGHGPPLNFTHYPISHSLLMVTAWAVLFGLVNLALKGSRVGSLVTGIAVLSHWLLDLIVHHPDLPLFPGGGPRVGLGLWGSPLAALAVELLIFGVGTWYYVRATEARTRTGTVAFWSLIAFLLAIQLGNTFGAPPPSVAAVAWVGQAQWLLVAWGFWVDRHRQPRAGLPESKEAH